MGKIEGEKSLRWKRLASLVVLFLQSTTMVLFMRATLTAEGRKYRPTTAVVLSEFVKVVVCIIVCYFQMPGDSGKFQNLLIMLKAKMIDDPADSLKMAVPSAIYAFQNNILYYALNNLEAATFQVTYQLKILTTALLSVIILKKKLTPLKWIALVILTTGVALVQLHLAWSEPPKELAEASNAAVGFVAVITACFSSAFAGVYMEKILKSKSSIWVRNIQMGSFGILFAGIMMAWNDGAGVWKDGMLYGYNWQVWWVVMNNALGGLVVAVVVKYADTILKGFALSISILLSSIISMVVQHFRPSFTFVTGAVFVLFATFLYGRKGKASTATPLPTTVSDLKDGKDKQSQM